MRCKACDRPLIDSELGQRDPRDPSEDNFRCLCTACYNVSEAHCFEQELYWGTLGEEQRVIDRRPSVAKFDAAVKKHNLEAIWADGLGLMGPKKRVEHFRAKAWAEYVDNLKGGHQPTMALDLALKVRLRPDMRRTNQIESKMIVTSGGLTPPLSADY